MWVGWGNDVLDCSLLGLSMTDIMGKNGARMLIELCWCVASEQKRFTMLIECARTHHSRCASFIDSMDNRQVWQMADQVLVRKHRLYDDDTRAKRMEHAYWNGSWFLTDWNLWGPGFRSVLDAGSNIGPKTYCGGSDWLWKALRLSCRSWLRMSDCDRGGCRGRDDLGCLKLCSVLECCALTERTGSWLRIGNELVIKEAVS